MLSFLGKDPVMTGVFNVPSVVLAPIKYITPVLSELTAAKIPLVPLD